MTSTSITSDRASAGLLTLFCDSSFSPETGAAGFGAWYRTDAMEKGAFFGGTIPVSCRSSNDAEFWGIVLALRAAMERIAPLTPSAVVLQCDNIHALAWVGLFHMNARPVGAKHETHPIGPPPARAPKSMKWAVQALRAMSPDVAIWLKHVKGHSKDRTVRSWVNEGCDRLAAEYMTRKRGSVRA